MEFGVSEIYVDTGILYVDNSILSTLAMCETKALMQYGYHLVPDDGNFAAMRAGTAVHKALEIHYLGGTPDEALNELFEDYYRFATENVPATDRLAYDNVAKIVRSWIWHHPLDSLPYHVTAVEAPFAIPLSDDGKIVYVGCIDAYGTRTDGKGLILIDNKSTGRIDAKFFKQFVLGSQMTGYWWALEQMIGPVSSCYINVIDMRVVPSDPKRKCNQHKTVYAECGFFHMGHQLGGPYYRSKKQIETWKSNALRLARKWRKLLDMYDIQSIQDAPQSGQFVYQACSLCMYDNFCLGGRKIQEDLFNFQPWLPGPLAEMYESEVEC